MLDQIMKLENLPIKLEYFYPMVDPHHIKDKHLNDLKNGSLSLNTMRLYLKAETLYKKTSQIISDNNKNKFYLIQRPDQNQLFQSFNSNDPISVFGNVALKKNNERLIKETLKKIFNIFPNISKKDKDLFVLLTIILCDNKYYWIVEYNHLTNTFYKSKSNIKVTNVDNKKYFITSDKKGIFKQKNQRKIEKHFTNIKIFSLEEFVNKFKILNKSNK